MCVWKMPRSTITELLILVQRRSGDGCLSEAQFLSEGADVCEQKDACVREKVSYGP